mmetsp:Transcript_35292/g.73894  ORF Transcript_35292/g.73894 Transcript_35292/m.73894 type:complete len:161 (+) Transcript_35292:355-837(+)
MITALRYWIDGQMASRENNIQNPGRGCWILDCWAMFGLWLSNFERDGICALILFTVRVDVSSTRGLTRATSLSIWGIDSPSLSEGSTVPTAWSLSLSFLPFECNLIPPARDAGTSFGAPTRCPPNIVSSIQFPITEYMVGFATISILTLLFVCCSGSSLL